MALSVLQHVGHLLDALDGTSGKLRILLAIIAKYFLRRRNFYIMLRPITMSLSGKLFFNRLLRNRVPSCYGLFRRRL